MISQLRSIDKHEMVPQKGALENEIYQQRVEFERWSFIMINSYLPRRKERFYAGFAQVMAYCYICNANDGQYHAHWPTKNLEVCDIK